LLVYVIAGVLQHPVSILSSQTAPERTPEQKIKILNFKLQEFWTCPSRAENYNSV